MTYHKFLNDFIFDITAPILAHRGIIYQYVDDEIVVSWDVKQGFKNAHCIRTFFEAKSIIHENRESYYNKYRLVPQLHASFHCGHVIIGEIGDVKSEIAFYGDTMNTTSRILAQCIVLNKEILISTHLMYRLDLPPIFENEACGNIQLKGKEKPLELYTVKQAKLQYL
jgi:adenylate cyclase